jgi:hypothetical protein
MVLVKVPLSFIVLIVHFHSKYLRGYFKFSLRQDLLNLIQTWVNSHSDEDPSLFKFKILKMSCVHQPHLTHLFSIITTYAFYFFSPSPSFSIYFLMVLPFFLFDQKYLCGKPLTFASLLTCSNTKPSI